MFTFFKNLFKIIQPKTQEQFIEDFKAKHEVDILTAMGKLHKAIEGKFPCYEDTPQITLDWLTCPTKQFKINTIKDIVLDENGLVCIQVEATNIDGIKEIKNLSMNWNIDRSMYKLNTQVVDWDNPIGDQGQIKQFLIKASLLSKQEVNLMFHGPKTWERLQKALKHFNINADEKS